MLRSHQNGHGQWCCMFDVRDLTMSRDLKPLKLGTNHATQSSCPQNRPSEAPHSKNCQQDRVKGIAYTVNHYSTDRTVMSDSQKSVLNLELCGQKLRRARKEPSNPKYPPCFKEYRERLFFKRDAAETRIYEVFAPNVFNHEPYEYQRIDPGVYNVENSHWALLLEKSHVIVSFVWKVGPSKDDTRKRNVTGGNCLVHVDRQIRPPRPDILSDLEDAMEKAESNSAPQKPKPLEIPADLGRPKALGITSLSVANIQKVGM